MSDPTATVRRTEATGLGGVLSLPPHAASTARAHEASARRLTLPPPRGTRMLTVERRVPIGSLPRVRRIRRLSVVDGGRTLRRHCNQARLALRNAGGAGEKEPDGERK